MNLSSVVDTLLNINDFAVVWHCSALNYKKTVNNEFTVANKLIHQCAGPKSEEKSIFFKPLWITIINRSRKPAKIDAYIRNMPHRYVNDVCHIKFCKSKAGKNIHKEVNHPNKQNYSLARDQKITLGLCTHFQKWQCTDIKFTLEINGQVAYFYDFFFNKSDPFRNTNSKQLKQERVVRFYKRDLHYSYYIENAVKIAPTSQTSLDEVWHVIPPQQLANTRITNSITTTVTTVVNTTVETVFNSNISNKENSIGDEENSSPIDLFIQDSSRKETLSVRFHPDERSEAKPEKGQLNYILN